MIVFLKTAEEIEGFKLVGKETGRILSVLIENIKPGISTYDLNEIAIEECKKNSGIPTFLNYKGYTAAICASPNEVLVHGLPNKNPLKTNDILSIDFGLTINGYIGDVAKTVVVGNEPLDLVKSCEEALNEAIKVARPGNLLSDVSSAIYNTSKKYKYLVPTSYGGHGIDRYILHSAPYISNIPDKINDISLRAGMVLAIEPMFIDAKSKRLTTSEDGWSVVAMGNTAHFEHTILITDNEPFVLTN